jgi:hypothetical protein
MSYLKVKLTTTVFISFGDISATRQTSLSFYLLGKFTEQLYIWYRKNPPHSQRQARIRNCVKNWCIIVLFCSSLPGYALLSASPTAANDFDAKQCSIMNTRFVRECTFFEPA